jgi:hypothetical protein
MVLDAGSVDDIAGRNLPATRLQKVLVLGVPAARDLLNDGEDRSDGNVHVDVA